MAGLTGCESYLELPIWRNPAECANLRPAIAGLTTLAGFRRGPQSPAQNSSRRDGQPFKLAAALIYRLERPAAPLRRSGHLPGLCNSFTVQHAASGIKRWRTTAIQKRLETISLDPRRIRRPG
jgi:hypothetical protein